MILINKNCILISFVLGLAFKRVFNNELLKEKNFFFYLLFTYHLNWLNKVINYIGLKNELTIKVKESWIPKNFIILDKKYTEVGNKGFKNDNLSK